MSQSSVKYWLTEVEDYKNYIQALKNRPLYGNYCITRNITHDNNRIIVDNVLAMFLSDPCINLIIKQLEIELELAQAQYNQAILNEAKQLQEVK
jgi:tricorn protease-like protein